MSAAPGQLDLRRIFGVTAEVTTSAESTHGEFVEMDCTVDPGRGTDLHTHPDQTERYEVADGVLDVYFDGSWRHLTEGQSFEVPAGTIHAFRNSSNAPARFVNRHTPALRFQQHLETVDSLIRTGKVTSLKDPRSLMHLCMSAVENQPDVPVKPPQWVIRTMAFIGRRLGLSL